MTMSTVVTSGSHDTGQQQQQQQQVLVIGLLYWPTRHASIQAKLISFVWS